ncbi:hypothetical protein [Streptacidiphilus jiangxiensis]|uniref:Uncharacterized protein n=1 Tax=Streptacidiphilus jiangxiensis TaxID=235985 RepID=A0A1H7J354_STRJI|nr:hypothetical protein [Streptacidiphilus jiangxiensis]SEK67555.1 hypothetical protein SAMN05414137_10372 [Streptacidiphilus jiangxiensis]
MGRSTTGLVIGGLLASTVLVLAGCGSDRGGSVALGDPAPAPALTTPSHSGVVFVPLDSPTPGGGAGTPGTPGTTPTPPTGSTGSTGTSGGAGGGSSGGAPATGQPGTPGNGSGGGTGGGPGSGGSGSGGSGSGSGSGGGSGGSAGGTGGTPTGAPTGTPTSSAPQTPASLKVAALHTADTGQRWCQRVTLTLINSGDRAATAGTVTFATHVIGALGVDWWTYQTSQPLAAPVAGHASADESWTVCLDSWRVPAGMHLETRSATLG